jgi:hypothetical protein
MEDYSPKHSSNVLTFSGVTPNSIPKPCLDKSFIINPKPFKIEPSWKLQMQHWQPEKYANYMKRGGKKSHINSLKEWDLCFKRYEFDLRKSGIGRAGEYPEAGVVLQMRCTRRQTTRRRRLAGDKRRVRLAVLALERIPHHTAFLVKKKSFSVLQQEIIKALKRKTKRVLRRRVGRPGF